MFKINKKGSVLIVGLVLLGLFAIGIGIYFFGFREITGKQEDKLFF